MLGPLWLAGRWARDWLVEGGLGWGHVVLSHVSHPLAGWPGLAFMSEAKVQESKQKWPSTLTRLYLRSVTLVPLAKACHVAKLSQCRRRLAKGVAAEPVCAIHQSISVPKSPRGTSSGVDSDVDGMESKALEDILIPSIPGHH